MEEVNVLVFNFSLFGDPQATFEKVELLNMKTGNLGVEYLLLDGETRTKGGAEAWVPCLTPLRQSYLR